MAGNENDDQPEVFRRVLAVLDSAGIQYMVVGSFAGSMHGFARFSHDLDLVVGLSEESVLVLADQLGDEFYLDPEWMREAISHKDMFNIIHMRSNAKVDFWVLKDDEFSRLQFSRRKAGISWGIPVYVESPEDTVLSKLLWNRITPSERQVSDVKEILLAQRPVLDFAYLREWAVKLGLADVLETLIEEVGPLSDV